MSPFYGYLHKLYPRFFLAPVNAPLLTSRLRGSPPGGYKAEGLTGVSVTWVVTSKIGTLACGSDNCFQVADPADAASIDRKIVEVENEITDVEMQIGAAETKAAAAEAQGNLHDRDYWRKKEEQLRKKEEQLRKEKEQLREKELQIGLAKEAKTSGEPRWSCQALPRSGQLQEFRS